MIKERTTTDGGFSISAFVQITILHFQVASLLKVKFQDGSSKSKSSNSYDGIRCSVSDIFNFRFSVYQGVCPSDDLTLPEKEMLLFGMKLATFAHLLMLGIIFVLLKMFCCKMFRRRQSDNTSKVEEIPLDIIEKNSSEEVITGEEETKEVNGNLTFIHRLEITFIKFLKMYYTPGTCL